MNSDLTNAVKIEHPKQQWYFSMETAEEKLNLISLLEQSIRAALQG